LRRFLTLDPLLNMHLISTGLEYTQKVCAIPLSHAVDDNIPAGTNKTEMRNLTTTPRLSQLNDVRVSAGSSERYCKGGRGIES
jgi:hypothetical protein